MEKVKFLIKGFVTNLIFTSILFICAGRIDYTQGWIFLSANVLSTLISYFTIYKNSELINERSKPGEDYTQETLENISLEHYQMKYKKIA